MPEAQRGSIASAGFTATRSRRRSPSRRRQSPKVCNGSTASPMTSSGSSTPEANLQLTALLPKQRVLMAFDLVFSPNEHAFTIVDHFDHWMIILESLKALQGYDTITIGHDAPVQR